MTVVAALSVTTVADAADASADANADANTGVGVDADGGVGVDADADAGVGVDADADGGVGVDADAGADDGSSVVSCLVLTAVDCHLSLRSSAVSMALKKLPVSFWVDL